MILPPPSAEISNLVHAVYLIELTDDTVLATEPLDTLECMLPFEFRLQRGKSVESLEAFPAIPGDKTIPLYIISKQRQAELISLRYRSSFGGQIVWTKVLNGLTSRSFAQK